MILILNLRYSRASEVVTPDLQEVVTPDLQEVVTPDLQQVWMDEIMESVRTV